MGRPRFCISPEQLSMLLEQISVPQIADMLRDYNTTSEKLTHHPTISTHRKNLLDFFRQ